MPTDPKVQTNSSTSDAVKMWAAGWLAGWRSYRSGQKAHPQEWAPD